MPIEIANRCPATRPDRTALRRLVRGVLAMEGRSDLDVTLVLADDAFLRGLNARYRRLDKTTDVLSFEALEGPDPMPGEIYVSMDRVRVQARRYRHGEGAELGRLVIHGLLHLLGYDHMRAAERARMRARERACARGLLPRGTALLAARPARRAGRG